jgi:hypothetical protein
MGVLTGREVLLVVARHAAEHLGQVELTRDLTKEASRHQRCVIPAVDEQEYGVRSAEAGVTGWGVDPDLIPRRKDVAAQAMRLHLAGWDARPPDNVRLWRGAWHLDHGPDLLSAARVLLVAGKDIAARVERIGLHWCAVRVPIDHVEGVDHRMVRRKTVEEARVTAYAIGAVVQIGV